VEEKNKVSIGLLREWWLIATQALVDEAGTEVTLANLRPYFIHTGMAGAHNIPVILGWSPERVASADVITPVYHIIFDAGGSLMHPLPDGSLEWISTGCATRGICQEACLCLCQYTGIGYFGEIAPDQEYLLDRSLSFGDQECRWLMKRKVSQRGQGQSPFYLETWKGEQLSIELNRYLAFSVIGEAWVNAVRALSDVVGSGRALELVVPGIRSSGMALGTSR